ncbi:adenosylcobinamide-phosphate synthase CbiB [Propioniciclava soli]|uniref:Cobalamin biosynthesis protein CobD n=1 Tax=Propioniciclava soli TaxID=2775081 RepID=A0ABZ3C7I3_9ACTN
MDAERRGVHRSRRRSLLTARGLGLLLGLAVDAAWGDPERHHPVAWFGAWSSTVERWLYSDSSARGVAHTALSLAPVAVLGLLVDTGTRRHPLLAMAATALTTWVCVGARSLSREGRLLAAALASDDMMAARQRLPHLCGRDPAGLDGGELGRATVESLAENTADAAVASLFWGSVGGVTGLLVHRGANTLDAMVGHRTPRYRHFGTAAARLDDVLDWVPARVTAALACGWAPAVGGSTWNTARTVLRDAHDHPSPNGGWCEAAWAGALGVQLGGANVYGERVEVRGLLGSASHPRPDAVAVGRAAFLVTAVTWSAGLVSAVCLGWLARARAQRPVRRGRGADR